jgi:8-oxo-dGTP diphosphatase
MVRVTAAVIEREGQVLIARRGEGRALAGKWEFPGGKIEPGETPEQCLVREVREEFGIEAEI